MSEAAKEYLKRICKRAIDVPGVERATFDFADNAYPRCADVRVNLADGRTKWWHLNIEELEKLSYPDWPIDNFIQSVGRPKYRPAPCGNGICTCEDGFCGLAMFDQEQNNKEIKAAS